VLAQAEAQIERWRDSMIDADIAEAPETVNFLRRYWQVPPGTIVVSTLQGEKALWLAISIGPRFTLTSLEVGREDMAKTVYDLRDAITRRLPDEVLKWGSFLYHFMLGPVLGPFADPDSREAKEIQDIKLVIFDLDGPLRYLPVAVLHDGSGWLIERCALMIATPEVTTVPRSAPERPRVAAFGTTRAHPGWSALPAVADEIASIVGVGDSGRPVPSRVGALPGIGLLDEAFTRAALLDAAREFPILHIASHFAFAPADEQASRLLLGDGSEMTLAELASADIELSGVDLITLSACETGMGGGREAGRPVAGLGAALCQLGAGAVIATLWRVGDDSMARLMGRFYQALAAGAALAEALRQAQLALLHGGSGLGPSLRRGLSEAPDGDGPAAADPFDWAGIVLITGIPGKVHEQDGDLGGGSAGP
jgi:hypothetical protein